MESRVSATGHNNLKRNSDSEMKDFGEYFNSCHLTLSNHGLKEVVNLENLRELFSGAIIIAIYPLWSHALPIHHV